jgi:hypothetical protein
MVRRTITGCEWVFRKLDTCRTKFGYVNATDQEQAIMKAIESFGVTDPIQQSRLSAIKVKEVQA